MSLAFLLDALHINRDYFDTITNNPHHPTKWKWLSIDAVFASLDTQYRTLDLPSETSREFDIANYGAVIVELSQTYDWQKAVLPLALLTNTA